MSEILRCASAVIAKGGITSAEVAHTGLGATGARVRGQLMAGVSVWDLVTAETTIPYVVVPGNVGNPETLAHAVQGLSQGLRTNPIRT